MFVLFTIENFGNLIVLLVLQAVLGFDNLLYISIESPEGARSPSKKPCGFGASLSPWCSGWFCFLQ